jgi:hypothetical protein
MSKEEEYLKEANFHNMVTKYANQTIIQGTDMDMAICFGTIGLNPEGKDVTDYHTCMRMSHAQFKALAEHCNNVLKQIESGNK